jgi:hypothetical protein
MNPIFLTNLFLLGLILFLGSLVIFAIYRTVKNERAKNVYLPTMKVGDSVHFSTQNVIDCTVSNLNPTDNEDMVEVTVLINKSSLYPNK